MKEDQKENQPEKTTTALREEAVLSFWQKNNIFEQSLAKEVPQGNFVFYDGPPFASGLPHYGSLLSSVIKDVIPRYKTMRGYYVRRRWGWDCHGLPIESIVEKKLGLKTKKDIEAMGVEVFNESCRDAVLQYVHDWKYTIERLGRWVEFDNAYKTMDTTYMESVWWALKEMWQKGLLYEGRKVLLYCPRCETPLSKAEIVMDNSYKDVTEETATCRFKVKNPQTHNLPENTFILAWTTTPWTLPGNVALAVHADISYGLYRYNDEYIIVATSRSAAMLDSSVILEKEIPGSELVGIEYEPLFFVPKVEESGKKAWYVAAADFVTQTDGTGIVHTAVMYGEEDYQLGKQIDLPMVPLLTANGHFNDDAPELIRGLYFKGAEKVIKEDLEKRGLLFARDTFTHSYPHCYRCSTALYYNALSSWFIDIQKIKSRMIELNQRINWAPDHLKNGRFLKIMEGAPDWTISRNRYWASPLPMWKKENGETIVVGSINELKKMSRAKNKYFVMRHGQAQSNLEIAISIDPDGEDHLTEQGREQVKKTAQALKAKGITKIIISPFVRTRETAEIVSQELGVPFSIDIRLKEQYVGSLFKGKKWSDYYEHFGKETRRVFSEKTEDGETIRDMIIRMGEMIYDLEKNNINETILIISHRGALKALHLACEGLEDERAAPLYGGAEEQFDNAEFRELDFVPLPHNKRMLLDLHRPYIDEVQLYDEEGKPLKRITEVIDCWVESGAMPFAEYHYPFENKELAEKNSPGDFVAEYIGQTRAWFYYMHAVSTALFDHESFRNVSVTGNVIAEDGRKMSKSLGNYTDPIENINRFGSDALRFYLMASSVMQAEDLSFKNSELSETHNKIVNILWNSFQFYETYKNEYDGVTDFRKSPNVLDAWIVAYIDQVIKETTASFDAFDTTRAGRIIRDFINDLSTWYIRRSRERFKGDEEMDKQYALSTSKYVFVQFSKVIAPIMPFIAESIYQGVKNDTDPISVHLATWPVVLGVDNAVIEEMKVVRSVVSLALEARATAGIKIRQPLSKLSIKTEVKAEYLDVVKEELNIKEILVDLSQTEEVLLDTTITEELKAEGNIRELIRHIQSARKEKGLTPSDVITIQINGGEQGNKLVEQFSDKIKKTALISTITFDPNLTEGVKISIDSLDFTFVITQ